MFPESQKYIILETFVLLLSGVYAGNECQCEYEYLWIILIVIGILVVILLCLCIFYVCMYKIVKPAILVHKKNIQFNVSNNKYNTNNLGTHKGKHYDVEYKIKNKSTYDTKTMGYNDSDTNKNNNSGNSDIMETDLSNKIKKEKTTTTELSKSESRTHTFGDLQI